MAATDRDEITRLLLAWSSGDAGALDALMERVHDRLHRLAGRFMNQEAGEHTLQTTALVNEAYLRLVRQDRVQWRDQVHFFAIAGRVMRRILVDHARRNAKLKRGANARKLPLEALEHLPVEWQVERPAELLALDEALDRLAGEEAELAQVVELRYFGGLTQEEIAEVTGLSPATVGRRYRAARAWLYHYLTAELPAAARSQDDRGAH
jgi:RNA polymerase sigma factor (TIGR02999 family)